MAWVARDKTRETMYVLFAAEPEDDRGSWFVRGASPEGWAVTQSSYQPTAWEQLFPNFQLEPGEGPIEVDLVLKATEETKRKKMIDAGWVEQPNGTWAYTAKARHHEG